MLINTHKKGVLWCNDLAPCLTSLFGSQNVLDLVMGRGNLLSEQPLVIAQYKFKRGSLLQRGSSGKIIPGWVSNTHACRRRLEQRMASPIFICGDRTGFLNLYLNNSTDPDHPTFRQASMSKLPGVEKLVIP